MPAKISLFNVQSFTELSSILDKADLQYKHGGRKVQLESGKRYTMNEIMKVVLKLEGTTGKSTEEKKAAVEVLMKITRWDSKAVMDEFEQKLNSVQKAILHLHQKVGNRIAKCFGLDRHSVSNKMLKTFQEDLNKLKQKMQQQVVKAAGIEAPKVHKAKAKAAQVAKPGPVKLPIDNVKINKNMGPASAPTVEKDVAQLGKRVFKAIPVFPENENPAARQRLIANLELIANELDNPKRGEREHLEWALLSPELQLNIVKGELTLESIREGVNQLLEHQRENRSLTEALSSAFTNVPENVIQDVMNKANIQINRNNYMRILKQLKINLAPLELGLKGKFKEQPVLIDWQSLTPKQFKLFFSDNFDEQTVVNWIEGSRFAAGSHQTIELSHLQEGVKAQPETAPASPKATSQAQEPRSSKFEKLVESVLGPQGIQEIDRLVSQSNLVSDDRSNASKKLEYFQQQHPEAKIILHEDEEVNRLFITMLLSELPQESMNDFLTFAAPNYHIVEKGILSQYQNKSLDLLESKFINLPEQMLAKKNLKEIKAIFKNLTHNTAILETVWPRARGKGEVKSDWNKLDPKVREEIWNALTTTAISVDQIDALMQGLGTSLDNKSAFRSPRPDANF